MYYERTLTESLREVSRYFKVVMIYGPRQVGKTSLFKNIIEPTRKIVSLDNFEDLVLAQSDPRHFLEKYSPPVLIDEVQKAPNLFPYIKVIVDNSEERGLFWLTGSQSMSLMKNVTESLAGRLGILKLQGLSQSEKIKEANRPPFYPNLSWSTERPYMSQSEIFEAIVKGSYPQLFDGTSWETFYSSYLSTYVEKDVRDIVNVSKLFDFYKFLKLMAARSGQILNYRDISKSLEITEPTVKNWVSILLTSGLIYILPPYYRNLSKRVTKSPKMYFLDTGLCCHLNGIISAEMALNSPISGALFETYVVSEILKSYWHNGKEPFLFFYRDDLNREIDLIIEKDAKIWPIEIKKTSSPNLSMTKNFSLIDKDMLGRGAIICTVSKLTSVGNDVLVVPASYI